MSIDLNRPGHRRRPDVDQRPKIMSALEVVTADDHDSFFQVLACVQNELGEAGRDIAESWAQRQKESRAKEFKDVWRSLGQGRGLGIGTLYAMAEDQSPGWRYDAPLREMSPEEVEARRQSREEAARKNREEAAKKLEQAMQRAAAIMAAAMPATEKNPYLKRKLVSLGYGFKSIHADQVAEILGYRLSSNDVDLQGELLVVPKFRELSQDLAGPATLELIDGDGRKAALYGGGTGIWATGPFPAPGTPGLTFYVGEGAVTCLSVHQAMQGGIAVAAFSNGQLEKTAMTIRDRYPDAKIVLLADLIKATGEPDPKAVAASRAVGGVTAVPDFGPDRKYDDKDFNDLHALEGLDAVRTCIEARAAQVASIWDTPVDVGALLSTLPKEFPWLVPDRIPLGRGGIITGVGGASKTTLLTLLGVGCTVKELPFTEWVLEYSGKAVLVLTEDTTDDVHDRLHHLCRDMTTRQRELVQKNLIIYALAGTDVKLLERNERGVIQKCALFHALAAKIKDIGNVIFIGLDPALGLSEGDEQSQADQRALGKMADDLAVQTGATCALVTHAAKGLLTVKELDSHCSRGGGAVTDAGRFEIVMRTMTADEANRYGVTDLEERQSLVQVAVVKGNRIPPSGKVPIWLRRDHGGVLVSAGLQEPDKSTKGESCKLPKSAALVFEALKQAAMEYGQVAYDGSFLGVNMDQLRNVHRDLYTQRNPANGDRSERKALRDGTSKLVELGMIESNGQDVTFVGPGSEIHIANVMAAISERRGRNCGTERNFSELCAAKGAMSAELSGTSPLNRGSSGSAGSACSDDQEGGDNSERTTQKSTSGDAPAGPMTFSLDALTGEPLEVQP